MTRKRLLDRIIELFGRFKAEVDLHNKNSQFDINIYSESLLIPLLNQVYELELKDANYEQKNMSAVDLVDYNNRVAIQVTSTPSIEKIKKTLSTYIKDERFKNFDTIRVFILTSKQKSYSKKPIDEIVGGRFEFVASENVLDGTDVIKEVKSWISMDKIRSIHDFMEEQFAEDAIEGRRYHLENMRVTETQKLYPNILELDFQSSFYIGEINIDRDKVIKQSWETEFRLKHKASMRKVIQNYLYSQGLKPLSDWVDFENKIITFRDLTNPQEPLCNIVDQGTVEKMSTNEYCNSGDKYRNAFRNLLSVSFIELVKPSKISWLPKEKLFRFDASKILNDRKESWKGKKWTSRTIVKQIWNEEKDRIIAFRHLAFKVNVFPIYEKWYVSITPTYNVTFDGQRKHFKAFKFIMAQKLLDKNQTVHNHFRFIAYSLITGLGDDFVKYKYITLKQPITLSLTYTQTS